MSGESPLISVLVTVYNRESFLGDALQSILRSKYGNFEIIVCDDASTDRSFAVASKVASCDARVRVFRNERNLGQFQNRNRAAEHARGEFLKYLDSDDILYPHSLAIMLDAIVGAPDASHAISSPVIDPGVPYPHILSPAEAYRREFLERGCMSAGPSASIIRKQAFVEVGGYRYVGVVSDIDLWYRLAARWSTVLMPPSLVWWRQHVMQAFSVGTASHDYLYGEYQIVMDALEAVECPLNIVDRERAIARRKQHQARRLLRLAFRQKMPLKAKRISTKCGLTWTDLLQGFRRYS